MGNGCTEEILKLVSEDRNEVQRNYYEGFKNAPQALRDVLTGKNLETIFKFKKY